MWSYLQQYNFYNNRIHHLDTHFLIGSEFEINVWWVCRNRSISNLIKIISARYRLYIYLLEICWYMNKIGIVSLWFNLCRDIGLCIIELVRCFRRFENIMELCCLLVYPWQLFCIAIDPFCLGLAVRVWRKEFIYFRLLLCRNYRILASSLLLFL